MKFTIAKYPMLLDQSQRSLFLVFGGGDVCIADKMASSKSVPRRPKLELDSCIMHVETNYQDKLTAFQHSSWIKFLNCAARWRKLDCFEGEIALESLSILWLDFHDDGVV